MAENPIKFFVRFDYSQIKNYAVVDSLEKQISVHSLYGVLPQENRCDDISTADIVVTLYWTAPYHGTYENFREAYQASCVMTIENLRRHKVLSTASFKGKLPPQKIIDWHGQDAWTAAIMWGIAVVGEIPSQAIIQTFAGKAREILARPPRLANAPASPAGPSPQRIGNKLWIGPVLTILGVCLSLIGIPLLISLVLERLREPNPTDPYAIYVVVCTCPLPVVLIGLTMLVVGALYWRKTRKSTLTQP